MLQGQTSAAEAQLAAGQVAGARLVGESVAAARAKASAAAAMQGAVEWQVAAGAECARLKRLVIGLEQGSKEQAQLEASAKAALNSTEEVHAMASAAAQKWRQKVERVAKELAGSHRSQQPVVVARLREARQRLEQHERQAAEAEAELPQLKAEAKHAAREAQRGQEQLLAAHQQLVEAAAEQASAERCASAAIGRHEEAAVATVAAEQAAAAAEQEQRLLSGQQQLQAGRLRQLAGQVLHRQQEVQAMQGHARELQQEHRRALAAVMVAAKLKRRALKQELDGTHTRVATATGSAPPPAQQQQQGRPASRLAGLAVGPAAAPANAGQRQLLLVPDHSSGADGGAAGLAVVPYHRGAAVDDEGEPEQLDLAEAWQQSEWSYLSSPAVSPPSSCPPPPRTLFEAADLFCRRVRLRHAFTVLRQAAHQRGMQLMRADEWHFRRRQATCFAAWLEAAAETAAWLAPALVALRRRHTLRQWRAHAQQARWLRQAEAAADACRRRQLLRAGTVGLRWWVSHQKWRDGVHEAVVRLRLLRLLRFWRAWTRLHRMEAARCRKALGLYQSQLLRAAWQQWCWVQRGKVSAATTAPLAVRGFCLPGVQGRALP